MPHWLLKSEPAAYGWPDLVRDGATEWDGIRNAAAAQHLRAMQVGDEALFYHSGPETAAVGIVRIARAAQQDGDPRWFRWRSNPSAPSPARSRWPR